ncbi:hypothetical protein ACFV5G_12320 [Streptomyces sp. NPDC059766]|uniref:hypothetical protein n=1 Tax=Streptomyces sp. NPDC059766 TaxID=3346940 RepID=UPI0036576AB4
MDSYEGTATLEWWANRWTCFGRIGVRVTIRVTGNDWTCEATVEPSLPAKDRETFDFLMELDPLFTLRLDEDSTLQVNAVAGQDGRLILIADHAEADSSPLAV